jgi:hypothetical protein
VGRGGAAVVARAGTLMQQLRQYMCRNSHSCVSICTFVPVKASKTVFRCGGRSRRRSVYTCVSWHTSTNTDAAVAVAVAAAAAAEHSFTCFYWHKSTNTDAQLLLLRSLLQLPPHCVGDTQRLCCPMQGAGLLNRCSSFFIFLVQRYLLLLVQAYKYCRSASATRSASAAP